MTRIRTTLLSTLACAALLPAAAFASDIIHSAPTESGYTSHPDHARTAAAPANANASTGTAAPAARGDTYANGQSALGRAASPANATRTVDASQARTLNVKCGETVAFRNGDKTFAWKFDVAAHRPVSLAAISPSDFGASPLRVYVAPNEGERN
ncbi:CzcE family metal-binding protein [Paracidovorax anthurii]|uniref:Heavy-metal resistance protein CzcE n=1 Tax=Paracidovorax anthurii TaxID=78229 RepID=A0A328ZHW6_9BURK|nr:CzcE family metal-binding protein [Paracidovorax anthurii]RAR84803.1 heavy-metal resistance protein CzcE [Paracidovorax anthurii]